MHWRLKLAIQKTCASLPVAQDSLYYFLQRRAGSLRRALDPAAMWRAAIQMAGAFQNAGRSIEGGRVLEVGTGRRLLLPLGLFLRGAGSIVTVDLHRYLRPELALEAAEFVRTHRQQAWELFAPAVSSAAQLEQRLDALASARSLGDLLAAANITYLAPASAAATGLPSGSIDFHVSYTVFEHIPRPALGGILLEAGRLLRPGGLAYHQIDSSDHCSAEDSSIPTIHFLRFSGAKWHSLAGNRFAYHNRMRAPDYRALYAECGLEILNWTAFQDSRSLQALQAGFPLSVEFRHFSPEDLATTVIQALSHKPAVQSSPQ